MTSPAVTIITATYDLSGALRYSIQSALAQTFHGFELLVVGDACTDDSQAVVRAGRWRATRLVEDEDTVAAHARSGRRFHV